jgi:uncharacterized cupin superfamily protein
VQSVNIFDADNTEGRIDVAQQLGSSVLSMFVYDVEPGASSSPYHYEYEEEWMLVVEGTVVVRSADGEHTLRAGDTVCFPAGPDGAHKVMNRTDTPARTLMFSPARVPAVSVYPDSNKIAIWSGMEPDELIFKRETAVAWAEGENGWNLAS